MGQSIAFERLMMSIEATRGTMVEEPTMTFPFSGLLTPRDATHRPENHGFGTLAANYQSVKTRKWSDFAGEGSVDTNVLPFVLNGILAGGITTPTTPLGGVLTRDWVFTRAISADDIASYSAWSGDANIQQFAAAYLMFTQLEITNNAGEDTSASLTLNGMAQPVTKVAAATPPAVNLGSLLPGTWMSLYIDTGATPIGTTKIENPFILVQGKHTLPSGATYKFLGSGAGSNKSFSGVGRSRMNGVTTQLIVEVPNMDVFDLWDNGTLVKCRIDHAGDQIELSTEPPNDPFYHTLQVDTYGEFEALELPTNADSNRVFQLTIYGQHHADINSDARVLVRNSQPSLSP